MTAVEDFLGTSAEFISHQLPACYSSGAAPEFKDPEFFIAASEDVIAWNPELCCEPLAS